MNSNRAGDDMLSKLFWLAVLSMVLVSMLGVFGSVSAWYSSSDVWTNQQVYSVGDPIWIYWTPFNGVSTGAYILFQGPFLFEINIGGSQLQSGKYLFGSAETRHIGFWAVSLFNTHCRYVGLVRTCTTTLLGSTNFQVVSHSTTSTYSTPPVTSMTYSVTYSPTLQSSFSSSRETEGAVEAQVEPSPFLADLPLVLAILFVVGVLALILMKRKS
jgi:hypothetical protein